MKSIRIFKLTTGETIIAKTNLREGEALTDKVTLKNPAILAPTPNGLGIIPMFPWCRPEQEPSTVLDSKFVMFEPLDYEPHNGLITEYFNSVSKISIASSGVAGISRVK
jgi:hypothetical protein